MIKRLIQLGLAAALLAGLCAAEQKTVSGILMDKVCSADAIKKGEKVAKEHGVSCALMDVCAKTGFGIFTSDGRFVSFDAAGNKKAMAALKTSKKQTDIQATATGDVTGDAMKVATLKLN